MPFKPNYNFQRAERDRAKAAKKEERQQQKKERKIAEENGTALPEGTALAEDEAPPASGASE